MSVRKYIDINSTYRNRKSYPDAADFVIEMNSNIKGSSPLNADDPIVLSFPYDGGRLSGGSTNTQFTLSVASSNIINFYRNSIIQIGGNYYARVISYDNTTQVATVDITQAYPGFPPVANTPYTIRYEYPVNLNSNYQDTLIVPTPSITSVILGINASNINNAYKLHYIFFLTNNPDTWQYSLITSYDGTTKTATLANPINSILPPGTVYEILRYSGDNVKPLVYQGSNYLSNPACCNVSLNALIIPNLPVKNGYGGTLDNYPFLYVCVYSEKAITYNNVIISNTPASSNALFKVPISYAQGLSFLSLGSGMSHQIFFKENDSIRIKILLPNGEIVQFETPETNLFFPGKNFPIPSNPLLQTQVVLDVSH